MRDVQGGAGAATTTDGGAGALHTIERRSARAAWLYAVEVDAGPGWDLCVGEGVPSAGNSV